MATNNAVWIAYLTLGISHLLSERASLQALRSKNIDTKEIKIPMILVILNCSPDRKPKQTTIATVLTVMIGDIFDMSKYLRAK